MTNPRTGEPMKNADEDALVDEANAMGKPQRTKEARNAVPCTCPNPALHERECPYLLACAPYGRCARCTKALTLPSSMPGSGPDICGDCWRTSQRTNEAQVITEESKWPCFWCGSMQAHFTGYPGGLSTVPACEEHAKQYPREKAFGERKARTDSPSPEQARIAALEAALRDMLVCHDGYHCESCDDRDTGGHLSDAEYEHQYNRPEERDCDCGDVGRRLKAKAVLEARTEPAALTEDAILAKAAELYEALEEVRYRNDGIVAIIRALEWAAQTSGGVITTPGTLPPGPRTPARGPEEAGTFPRGERARVTPGHSLVAFESATVCEPCGEVWDAASWVSCPRCQVTALRKVAEAAQTVCDDSQGVDAICEGVLRRHMAVLRVALSSLSSRTANTPESPDSSGAR